MKHQNNHWLKFGQNTLPTLAIIGPVCWVIASVIRALGIGTLSSGLKWVSAPEGVLVVTGGPFFMGQRVTERFHKTGILVTVLGILCIAFLAFVSGLRVLACILWLIGPWDLVKSYQANSSEQASYTVPSPV